MAGTRSTRGHVGISRIKLTLVQCESGRDRKLIPISSCTIYKIEYIIGLPKPHHVKEVFEGSSGLLAGLKQGQIWIDHSTTDHEQNKVISFWKIFENSNPNGLNDYRQNLKWP